jgi:hypothetical protein
LATVDVSVSLMTEHGTHKASFSGPLLWDVLPLPKFASASSASLTSHAVPS